MSDKKISELNSFNQVKDDDIFVVVDSTEPIETKKVLGSNLKEYLGSIESYDGLEAFPEQGFESKLYLAKDTNKLYRWGGEAYVEIAIIDASEVPAPTGVSFMTDISSASLNYPFGQGEPYTDWYFGDIGPTPINSHVFFQHAISWDEPGSLSSVSHYSVDYSPDSGFTWFNLADGVQQSQLSVLSTGRLGLFPAYGFETTYGGDGLIVSESILIPLNIDSFSCCPNGTCSGGLCSYFNSNSLQQLAAYNYNGYARTDGPTSRRLEFRVRAYNEFGVASEYAYTSPPPEDYSELPAPTGISLATSLLEPGTLLFHPSLDSVGVLYEVQFKFKYASLTPESSAMPDEWTNINVLNGSYYSLVPANSIVGYLTGTRWFGPNVTMPALPWSYWNFRVRAVDQVKGIVSDWGYAYEEVLHYESLEAFPEQGDTYPVYVADDTGKSYRWQGSAYVEVTSVTPPLAISDIENLQEELDNKLSVDSVIDGGGY